MNYPDSQLILNEIKKANKILLNCHRGPDSDSVGSAMSMRSVLQGIGKEVVVVCPSDVPEDLKFVEGADEIQKIDFSNFDFSNFDLFISMDSSTYGMVSGQKELSRPDIKMVVIDHHFTNTGFGDINLIDSKTTSTAELLFKVFRDWNVDIQGSTATSLLTGIIGDTGCFQYAGVGKDSLSIAAQLIEMGANKDLIVFNLYRSVDFLSIKFWSRVIENMKIEDQDKFVWSAVGNELFLQYGGDSSLKEDVANLFFPIIKSTDFGVVMVESEKNVLSVSLRSRSDFDVSKIAAELGGGGHVAAAGAKVDGSFQEAVDKVLEVCRKYANKN